MDDRKCWELKPNCMMLGQPREQASCRAYHDGVSCWDVDWKNVVTEMPASQQEYWLSFLEQCPACVAYTLHPEEMQARIDAVKTFFLRP